MIQMLKLKSAMLVLPFITQIAVAVCPGFNFAIGNVQPLGGGINRCKLLRWCTIDRIRYSDWTPHPRERLRRQLQRRRRSHYEPKPMQ